MSTRSEINFHFGRKTMTGSSTENDLEILKVVKGDIITSFLIMQFKITHFKLEKVLFS